MYPDLPIRPIPTNLITGFLGVGKTTAIRDLAARRPPHERWAILVNEYGEVGLDQAMIEGGGDPNLAVSEIAGGCFCCSMELPLEWTLDALIRTAKPHRLVIEPTGLGHPARVLDHLRSARFREILDVRTTICLADPRDFENPRISQSPVFQDQLHLADIVVINKTDVVAPEVVAQFRNHVEQDLFPAKLLVTTTRQGRLEHAWLDWRVNEVRTPLFPEAHPVAEPPPSSEPTLLALDAIVAPATQHLVPGQPIRFPASNAPSDRCGWIFSPDDIFDRDALLDMLGGGFSVSRIKGVFRVADDWILFNRVGWEMSVQSTSYRRDSRVEVILDHASRRWDEFQYELLRCVVNNTH